MEIWGGLCSSDSFEIARRYGAEILTEQIVKLQQTANLPVWHASLAKHLITGILGRVHIPDLPASDARYGSCHLLAREWLRTSDRVDTSMMTRWIGQDTGCHLANVA